MDGLLVVDKPVGPTSHDVVARVRRATGERRIGHTGTLDPGASGVLPLVLGRATRLARFLSGMDKSYTAVVRLGVSTDTFDAAGQPVGEPYCGAMPDRRAIERALESFCGTYLQQPPIFSAKKIGGVRSHRLARQRFPTGADASPRPSTLLGTTLSLSKGRISSSSARDGRRRLREGELDFQLASVSVTVSDLRLLDVRGADVELALTCSAGFYVRTLANDLGRHFGTGAHLAELRRTSSGDLQITDGITLDRIEREPAAVASALIPPARMLTTMPSTALTEEGVRKARHGQTLDDTSIAARSSAAARATTRLLDPAGDLIGIAEPGGAPGLLHPVVILV